MDLQSLSERCQGLVQSALTRARTAGHQSFMPEHVLRELLADPNGLAANIMRSAGASPEEALVACEEKLAALPVVEGPGAGHLVPHPETLRLLEHAAKTARAAADRFVTAERLLDAAAALKNSSVARILNAAGLEASRLEAAIGQLRKGRTADSAHAESSYDAIRRFTRDLTNEAREGRVDAVIGRDEEIRRVMQILARRTKNNPVLIGEPGVGKTAIVEGLAMRVVNGDVPESLRDARIYSLDLGALVAGAKYQGEFEERLKAVLNEVEHETGIVLFIDEMHTLIGAGAPSGSTDASNLLKPALARGVLHCIGATTLDEYRKHVEKDAALARRFQPVYVAAPSVEDTVSILRGIKEKYDLHHGVTISDAALVAAATLSDRYISDRFLPDKAIDLIDEAAARKRMEIDSKPEALDELDRRIVQLKIEREALRKETDAGAATRLTKLEDELAALEEEASARKAEWLAAKDVMAANHRLKEQLDKARSDLQLAQRAGDLARAGELAHGTIPILEANLAESDQADAGRLAGTAVLDSDVAAVVARWTGIPTENLLASEAERLLHLESVLESRVVGQDDALRAVASAVRRAKAGLQDPNRPLGSFLFLGPTGVGKTELAKALAEFLFRDERALLRFDMSEYMEKHSVARMLGAPPGYVGYEDGGALTEAVRRRPYQVILFDEIEKAHPDIFNVLLQVLDDGCLTDSQGHLVNFRNTLVILTSNIGGDFLGNETMDEMAKRHAVMEEVRTRFRPEFLNRLDEIIQFRSLAAEHMDRIVNIQLDRLVKRASRQHLAIDVTEDARAWLANRGYDPAYGARPLKRVIQREVENPLAALVLAGGVRAGGPVRVSCDGDSLRLQ
ncbi:MAG: ATP-dependent chaperone ClpB [Rhodospirillales bacterium]|nr:ATP-dependent chaperone ClpB [Rhodospirillales bacterium]